jgi:hypothetical protein
LISLKSARRSGRLIGGLQGQSGSIGEYQNVGLNGQISADYRISTIAENRRPAEAGLTVQLEMPVSR